jgi:hypothetical protein
MVKSLSGYRSPKALACLLFASGLLALQYASLSEVQAAPAGEPDLEIWVDGPLDIKPGNDPRQPDAAVDHRGRKIFVWDSNGGEAGQDIFLRIFESDGTALTAPSQVNTVATSTQDYPRVAVAADNSFLVIWQSGEPPASNPSVFRDMVRSQAYDATGQKVGVEQLLSTLEPLGTTDISANVAALKGGGYVVCWQSANTATAGYNNITIQARMVNANGTPNGDQFQVNALHTGSVIDCDVAPLPDGGFVVVWTNPEIHARRFAADGTAAGTEIQVNTIDINAPRDESAVATSDDGRVLVVWTDTEGTDTVAGTKTEVRARLFNSTLSALGTDFRVNDTVTGDQDWPKVAPYGDDFFVVWQSEVSSGPDGEPDSIEGRVITGANQFDGSQFLVNGYVLDSQGFPGIGGLDGRVAISWRSRGNDETSQNVIQGLGWSVCGIFCNGFE